MRLPNPWPHERRVMAWSGIVAFCGTVARNAMSHGDVVACDGMVTCGGAIRGRAWRYGGAR